MFVRDLLSMDRRCCYWNDKSCCSWLGLHQADPSAGTERTWTWGNANQCVSSYEGWGPGEPNDWHGEAEDCGLMLPGGSGHVAEEGTSGNLGRHVPPVWNDVKCDLKSTCVCEAPAVQNIPAPPPPPPDPPPPPPPPPPPHNCGSHGPEWWPAMTENGEYTLSEWGRILAEDQARLPFCISRAHLCSGTSARAPLRPPTCHARLWCAASALPLHCLCTCILSIRPCGQSSSSSFPRLVPTPLTLSSQACFAPTTAQSAIGSWRARIASPSATRSAAGLEVGACASARWRRTVRCVHPRD